MLQSFKSKITISNIRILNNLLVITKLILNTSVIKLEKHGKHILYLF